ncbi:MAG TPA: 3-hydroxyacyl-ACP dehydratase FabZ family protein [Urbifossiella sp.]|jgi:3-hydroxyacyl-[acyl-carrier-protein] dehydratase|nr:3-hydroxyacyl-ACP dehydratase FabZ family protein [Urbifossiella sp.]
MSAEVAELDVSTLDLSRPIAGIAEIQAINPHRFEMEMLTAVVLIDPARKLVVGYKDLTASDFWVRGHMPGFPLLPGVLMCEAAAQLCCYYTVTQKVCDADSLMGLGGIDETKFLRPVRPGDRLVLVGTGIKVHRRLTKFRTVGYVNAVKVFETTVTGVPIGKTKELQGA